MASSAVLIASLLLSAFVLQLVQAQQPADGPVSASIYSPPTGKIDCKAACIARCSMSKRPNLCQRACGSCCHRCNCVPPGTYGNYDACPCYASLTTRGNRRKCP
uniref:Gibberellin regulated protein n=1 Tax=Opuntia streptacantha TaxID=393608 RepID=A0A7C9D5R9_OPUST